MKILFRISFAALLTLLAISCDKDPEEGEADAIINPTEIQVGHEDKLGDETYAVFKGGSFKFKYLLVPYKSTAQEVRWESSNTAVATVQNGTVTGVSRGTAKITATVYNGGKKGVSATRTVYVIGGKKEVDLGLTCKWAEFNLGEDETGLGATVVAWGELSEKTGYSLNNYKWYSGGYTKYNATDGLKELAPADDIVAQVWKGNWKMPTALQAQELLAWCNSKKAYYYSGKHWYIGYLFISKKNGEFIFFSDCYSSPGEDIVDYHFTWTSTRGSSDVAKAYSIYIDLKSNTAKCDAIYSRYLMLPVRPVLNK